MKTQTRRILILLETLILLLAFSCAPTRAYAAAKPKGTSITAVSSQNTYSFKVKWKKAPKASGYQLQYAENPSFKHAKTYKIAKAKSTAKTVYTYRDNRTYYVRIRTFQKVKKGKIRYSKWSKKKTVTTKPIVYTYYANGKIRSYYDEFLKMTSYEFRERGSQYYGLSYLDDAVPFSGAVSFADYYNAIGETWESMNEDDALHYIALCHQLNITPEMSDLEKYMIICRWMGENVTYAYYLDGVTPDPSMDTTPEALRYGKVVCEGYSRMTKDLCHIYDIPCVRIHGMMYPTDYYKHAWNCVYLAGKWIQVDNTGGPKNFYMRMNRYFEHYREKGFSDDRIVALMMNRSDNYLHYLPQYPSDQYLIEQVIPLGCIYQDICQKEEDLSNYQPYYSKEEWASYGVKAQLIDAYRKAASHTYLN